MGRIGRVQEHLWRSRGMGYVTGLDTPGSSVAVAVSAPTAGAHRVLFRVANATGRVSTLTVRALHPTNGDVHGSATLKVPTSSAWSSWRRVPVTFTMGRGTNLVVCGVEASDQGAVNLDYVALA